MGQRTLKASEVEKLIEVVKAMKDGDFLGVKKVGGTRWSVRTRFRRRKRPIDESRSTRQD